MLLACWQSQRSIAFDRLADFLLPRIAKAVSRPAES
jgi:hypothetical protein